MYKLFFIDLFASSGSGVEAIHYAGSLALNDLAKAFELADITELIKMNVDYFTHHVNIKLRKVSILRAFRN